MDCKVLYFEDINCSFGVCLQNDPSSGPVVAPLFQMLITARFHRSTNKEHCKIDIFYKHCFDYIINLNCMRIFLN